MRVPHLVLLLGLAAAALVLSGGWGGLRLRIGWLVLFAELSEISNLNESKGYDPYYHAGAVGFLVEY